MKVGRVELGWLLKVIRRLKELITMNSSSSNGIIEDCLVWQYKMV